MDNLRRKFNALFILVGISLLCTAPMALASWQKTDIYEHRIHGPLVGAFENSDNSKILRKIRILTFGASRKFSLRIILANHKDFTNIDLKNNLATKGFSAKESAGTIIDRNPTVIVKMTIGDLAEAHRLINYLHVFEEINPARVLGEIHDEVDKQYYAFVADLIAYEKTWLRNTHAFSTCKLINADLLPNELQNEQDAYLQVIRESGVLSKSTVQTREELSACSICLEKLILLLNGGKQLIQAHCPYRHIFCKSCFETLSSNTCPNCRGKISSLSVGLLNKSNRSDSD